jgi:hypothetical protein
MASSPKTHVVFVAIATGEELGTVAASPAARVADLLFETDIPVLSPLLDVDGGVLPDNTRVSALSDPVVQVLLNKRGVFKARHHPEAFVIHPPTGKTMEFAGAQCDLVGTANVYPGERYATDFYHDTKTGTVHAVVDRNSNYVVHDIAPSLAHLVRLLRAGCALIDAGLPACVPARVIRLNASLGALMYQTFVRGIEFRYLSKDSITANMLFQSLVNQRSALATRDTYEGV